MKHTHMTPCWWMVSLILAACAPQQVVSPTVITTPVLTTTPAMTATVTSIPPPTAGVTASAELPISPAASAYLEEALDIMQNYSLHKHNIDWEALRISAFKMAERAQTPADTYGTIRYILFQLGDRHSMFWTPNQVAQQQEETMSDSPAPRAKLMLGKLGYIAIEGFSSGKPVEVSTYATTVQQLIRELDTQNACGWIVDLRDNAGGNMWPMLAGIGPILGEGEVGAAVDADGNKRIWSYQNGLALSGDHVMVDISDRAYELKASSPPVAVLTGIYNGSAGEGIVVAFRGRPNTRSFGLYTAGQSTSNGIFPLSDGAWLVLTVAVYADRTGQTYGDRIYPDEIVDDVRKFTYLMDEAIPQPAIDWLMSQPECSEQ